MTETKTTIPSFEVHYAQEGNSKKLDELGMREMQARAYHNRSEKYLLIKSPPASGKSRALMFIALDKVFKQGLKRAIIIVPERTIGASFNDVALSEKGFWADRSVDKKYNLISVADESGAGTISMVGSFLKATSDPLTEQEKETKKAPRFLLCTHATFRAAVQKYGVEAFDDSLIAIDEFHHVSAKPDNVTGTQVKALLARGKTHMVAMTGSYFRGDGDAILLPEDEGKFKTVTYTYYEQLNGYNYLKSLRLDYSFYSGSYLDDLMKVLNPKEKTILYIPSVNAGESTGNKYTEVNRILDLLGKVKGTDPKTGFILIETPAGETLKVANLVDDTESSKKRDKVIGALKDPEHAFDKDHVDLIIALGMAKEGFDWIWCEHALAVGYRGSLTEVVQMIGRTTRDAPGKFTARFTNLIAEPDAEKQLVQNVVNDTLKAIAASLLMQSVMSPRIDLGAYKESLPESPNSSEQPGGQIIMDSNGKIVGALVGGLSEPTTEKVKRICEEDMQELLAQVLQDSKILRKGMFDHDGPSQDITKIKFGEIIRKRYPDLTDEQQETVRQQLSARLFLQEGLRINLNKDGVPSVEIASDSDLEENLIAGDDGVLEKQKPNTVMIDNVQRFSLDVRNLNIDLIDSVNPFSHAYKILSKGLSAEVLEKIDSIISDDWKDFTPEEALEYAREAQEFINRWNRRPEREAFDEWERKLARGARAFAKFYEEGAYNNSNKKEETVKVE